jgi:hypothetical protein
MNIDKDSVHINDLTEIIEADAEVVSVVDTIQVAKKTNDIVQNTDTEIVAKIRKLSELTADDKPVIPLPPDDFTDIIYITKFENRCVLCRSPWRERAEHWYLANGRKPNSVVNFFRKYFNASVSWECVDTHMNSHCTLKSLGKDGLADLEQQESELARWRYRELDLAILGTLDEINRLRSISSTDKLDFVLRRANQLNLLYARLVDYKRQRDEASVNMKVDVFAVLMEVYNKLPDPQSRKVLYDTIQELREQYA